MKEGYFLGYGVTISFIFLLLTGVFLLKELHSNNKIRQILLQKKEIAITLVCSVVFIFIGLVSSYLYSPFFLLSFVWLIQYSFLLVVALSTFTIKHLKKTNLLFAALIASSLFQFALVLLQFLKQRSIGLEIEFNILQPQFFTGLDEVNTFFRVNGTFMYHNQLALICTIFFVIFFVLSLYEKRKSLTKLLLLATITNVVAIIFTQTRTMWLVLPLTFVVIYFFDKSKLSNIKNFFKDVNIKLLIFLCILLFSIILPRTFNSFNATSKGSGIWIRAEMISEGLLALQGSPIVGYGIATNEHTLFKQFPLGIMSVYPAAIHMAFLQLALEVGVLGLFAFLLPFVTLIRYFIVNKVKNKYALIYLCGIFVFASYYSLQPHVFILEGQYLGLIFGLRIIGIYEK